MGNIIYSTTDSGYSTRAPTPILIPDRDEYINDIPEEQPEVVVPYYAFQHYRPPVQNPYAEINRLVQRLADKVYTVDQLDQQYHERRALQQRLKRIKKNNRKQAKFDKKLNRKN